MSKSETTQNNENQTEEKTVAQESHIFVEASVGKALFL